MGFTNSATYGVKRCGNKSYEIRDSNNNIVNWVTVLSNGTLKIAPDLSTAPGKIDLTLTVSMIDYKDNFGNPISAETSFSVTVTQCVPTIDITDS